MLTLADLPSLEVLRASCWDVLNTPATDWLRLLNTPASQLRACSRPRWTKEHVSKRFSHPLSFAMATGEEATTKQQSKSSVRGP